MDKGNNMLNFTKWIENKETKKMILMRGISGSGKSYRAKKLADNDESKIFSADKWFEMQPEGYKASWAPHKLKTAHGWAFAQAEKAIQSGVNPVIIDNTNMAIWEVAPYVKLAKQYGYEVEIEESNLWVWKKIKELLKNKEANAGELEQWAKNLSQGFMHKGKQLGSTHGVPENVMLKMMLKYNPYTIEDIHDHISKENME